MHTIILSHDVKDFSEWKKVFDADESRRASFGIRLKGLYSSYDNPNQPTMIFEFPDIEVFNNFMADPELKNKMEMAGVTSEPEFKVLNHVNGYQ